MLDVIDFMERVGSDAQLSQASAEEFAASLSASDMAPELQLAMLARDAQRLGTLLGAAPECLLLAPPGPPGTGPSPMQPATPPPPPEETEETEEVKDVFESGDSADKPVHRRGSQRV
ncbi:hypothetical protein I6J77_10370 [Rhodanobacter sp. FDAARGOS 1247]|uniref:hypothetical protein n=1 Tax=Rhodanobacter sp. FDAARGOS 1247 TaxID=2778082 RepID=UPI0019510A56|nr:hypothetical protein [Rhodanobacter sp. FDAARGOS 1247]QRP62547.1 hypothetical protein I6J77_10370 [Rhodanobacter sp. FDAARGOS 1247]